MSKAKNKPVTPPADEFLNPPYPNGFAQRFWFTDGAAMAHGQIVRNLSWFVCFLLYAALNSFFLRVVSGSFLQIKGPYESRYLIDQLQFPLPILQFPSWIAIMALFMCLLCTIPIIISLYYNLIYAIPFVLAIVLLGHKPVLCMCVFVSCAAVSFEPFRFKSKYVASLLSLLPVVVYWWLYSGPNPEQDVLRWAVYYAPWGLAFLFCLVFLGVVVTVGHVTRYWPAPVPLLILAVMAITFTYFNLAIGLSERDYQAQVYRYRPDKNPDFASTNIVPFLMKELKEIKQKQVYLSDEAILMALRTEWKWTFNYNILDNTSPISMARERLVGFEQARLKAIQQIDGFIAGHGGLMPQDDRLVDAIYIKGLLSDLRPDMRALGEEDTLRFYYNRPSPYSLSIWQGIIERFGNSVVSVDACLRVALLTAARKPQRPDETYGFDEAIRLLDEGLARLETLGGVEQNRYRFDQFWHRRFKSIFTPPEPSVGPEDLARLKTRMSDLKQLISTANRTGHRVHDARLADFVALDSRRLEYEDRLHNLLNDSPNPDPLRDNIELALARLKVKEEERIASLKEIVREYPETDGAVEAARLLETLTLTPGIGK